MSYVVIRSILEVRLNANAGGVDVAFENVPYNPQSGTPYQLVHLLPGETLFPTMGDAYKRENGVFQVTLYYPAKEGPGRALARAEALRAAFPRGLAISQSNVRLVIDPGPSVARGDLIDGWYVLPVSIPFFADVS